MGRLWYVPFKKHVDDVSMNRNWTSLEEYLNSLEMKEVGPIGGGEKSLSAGVPSSSEGSDGDWRYVSTPASIYVKEDGSWILMFSRYLDSEAVTAMGTKGDGNPLHHDRYTDAQAAAKVAADDLYVQVAGDTMDGPLEMGANKITGVADPTLVQDAATKNYVDTRLVPISLGGGAIPTLGTIDGSGPTNAAQAQWAQVDVDGVPHWIPVWT